MVGTKLEQIYTWEQIADLFAQRIIDSKFLEEFNPDRFKRWFMERKKVGIKFDFRLTAKIYQIDLNLHKDYDHFTVIVAGDSTRTTGIGKSTLGAQIGAWTQTDMDTSSFLFDAQSYIQKLNSTLKQGEIGKTLILDEGGNALFSRQTMANTNVILAKTFMAQRLAHTHVIICIPKWWYLDTIIRDDRVDTLIMIKSRGYYKALNKKGISILNRLGKHDKSKPIVAIPLPINTFWEGNFRSTFPDTINYEDYLKLKRDNALKQLEEAQTIASSISMINIDTVSSQVGISVSDLVKAIQEKQIIGKQIGKKWFITKEQYDDLINNNINSNMNDGEAI